MDLGAMGFDYLVPSNPPSDSSNSKLKRCGGSGFLRSNNGNEEDGDDCKVAKTETPHHHHYHMLSFSSPNNQQSAAATFPYYQPSPTPFTRSAVAGMRGPFTPSQWMELEHQALIYKYITSNMAIPSCLMNPIRRAFESVGFPSLIRSNALGWGAFHLGFSSTDPEPGRCRRTDGKKWRCSRDAVADQKYCERHMNRGRHRSRKPVEGQSGNSASGIAAKTAPSAVAPPASGGASSGLDHHHYLTSLQPSSNSSRSHLNKGSADGMLPMMSCSKAGQKGKHDYYSQPLSGPEFGLVCSDSLLNPLNRSSSSLDDHGHAMQPERTHLSMSISIPPATTDFMSSTSSPTNNDNKLATSPPRLSHELEMGLGVPTTNWVPISWEPSMGGPLGEALHATTGECRTVKPLNLMDSSLRLAASSPTGVLQRGPFGSLSNSSTASSPRAETLDAGGLILMNPALHHQ